jgi:hypothetical protein
VAQTKRGKQKMVIVDEIIESSSGDRSEIIEHKPVLFSVEPKTRKRDYTMEKEQLSNRGEPYVGPLPREKGGLSMREIAGNKAYNYVSGVRYYDLTGTPEDDVEGIENKAGSFLSLSKWFLFLCVLTGIGILVFNQLNR